MKIYQRVVIVPLAGMIAILSDIGIVFCVWATERGDESWPMYLSLGFFIALAIVSAVLGALIWARPLVQRRH